MSGAPGDGDELGVAPATVLIESTAPRLSLLTVCAQAALACVIDDAGHEGAHALVTVMAPGIHLLEIASVGTSSDGVSPAIALAGPLFNLLMGACVLIARRSGISAAWRRFFWLIGVLNLFNAFAYAMSSAVTDSGDWAKVFAGVQIGWQWRVPLGVVGVVGYVLAVRWARSILVLMVRGGALNAADVRRLCVSCWWVASGLVSAAAALNPYDSSLVVGSGVSFFAANVGLWVLAQTRTGEVPARMPSMLESRSATLAWRVAGGVAALWFVAVLGPGIRIG